MIIKCMKKIAIITFSVVAALSAAAQSDNAVACIGKVVPGARISKLAAHSPAGTQAVIDTLSIKKGDIVERGAVVATIKGIDKAKASLERAEFSLNAARNTAEMKILQQKNMIADLEGTFDQNRRVLDEKLPPRREREELEYEQEALARRIAQSKAMLPFVEKGQRLMVAEAEAALEEARKFYFEFMVRSPISGEIVEVNVNPGEAVGMEGVCEIANTSTMYVDAEVYISDISKVKVGDKAEIFSDALGTEKFSGKVVQVSGYVKSNRLYSSDPSQYSNLRVVVAKIKIDNSAPFKNLIGSQVNVRIITK